MLYLYEVTSPSERILHLVAQNSQHAKRKACEIWGIRPGDKWCGVATLKAKRKERL
jgi:uncharacterized protein (DUF2237 family)